MSSSCPELDYDEASRIAQHAFFLQSLSEKDARVQRCEAFLPVWVQSVWDCSEKSKFLEYMTDDVFAVPLPCYINVK